MNSLGNSLGRKRSQKALSNEKGQMAVFVALIFQVLFVFFAMVINIGLVVHDKINLQNSVDLAAYYGAQKQAELLNEIAHINYQIRQDYKLMTWRMRVLGEFGRDAHPGSLASYTLGGQSTLSARPYANADQSAICVSQPAWAEARAASQNLCKQTNLYIPQIPPPVVVAPFNVFNIQIADFINQLRTQFQATCQNQGQFNWAFATLLFSGYKQAIFIRKQMIEQIAANLSRSSADFSDRRQASVRKGVTATLTHNLTVSNAGALGDIQVINSMGLGPCADPNQWLPEISIKPYLMYTDNNAVDGCHAGSQPIFTLPAIQTIMRKLDPDGQLANLAVFSDAQPVTNPWHSSLGFEKNPWCVAWYGVKASTHPRKPFAPFGQAVTLTARAFAQPFGGRVGPWYGSAWAPSDVNSSGDRVDPLTSPRVPTVTTLTADQLRFSSMPNYSRFPGDTLGLKSIDGIGVMRKWLWGTFPPNAAVLALVHYANLVNVAQTGDVLPWDSVANQPVQERSAELAAVSPDLFDITYYSVDADYGNNYYPWSDNPSRFQNIKAISDVGSRYDPKTMTFLSVKEQIAAVAPVVDLAAGYWYVKSPAHLLTGWMQNGAVDYSFPTGKFGVCATLPFPTMPAIGGCAQGGRVGYSVRHVSKDYLTFNGHKLGGADTSTGPILNPPASDF